MGWETKSLQSAQQNESRKGKRIPKDLALGRLEGLVIFSCSYYPALNLEHSGSLTIGRGGKESEARLGKECRVERTTKKGNLPFEVAQSKTTGNAGIPHTVLMEAC